MDPPRTSDGRWIVVNGRRWRATDPELPADLRAALQHHLGAARSAVRLALGSGDDAALRDARARVATAKRGLGERGEPWWELGITERRDRWTAALDDLDGR